MQTLRLALEKAGFRESGYARSERRLRNRCLLCGDKTRNGKRYHPGCLELHRLRAQEIRT